MNLKKKFESKKLIFLITINIVPFFLVFLTSFFLGTKIRTMWMTPFYLFFGVLVIYIFQSQINLNKLKGFTTVFIILFILSPFAYAYVSITETDKRTDYPGKEKAEKIYEDYELKKWKKINFVKGNEWEAGNLSYHLKERPKWIYSSKGNFLCGNFDPKKIEKIDGITWFLGLGDAQDKNNFCIKIND